MTKFKTCLIIILALCLSVITFQCIYPRLAHKMSYVAPQHSILIERPNPTYYYSKDLIRTKLEYLTGVKYYIYKEKVTKPKYYARTSFMFRTIAIDNSLTINEYVEVLCHELLHLKFNTANERFTQYQTFVFLYNSEFRQTALNILYKMQYGYYAYEYNCYSQIVEYLS